MASGRRTDVEGITGDRIGAKKSDDYSCSDLEYLKRTAR